MSFPKSSESVEQVHVNVISTYQRVISMRLTVWVQLLQPFLDGVDDHNQLIAFPLTILPLQPFFYKLSPKNFWLIFSEESLACLSNVTHISGIFLVVCLIVDGEEGGVDKNFLNYLLKSS